MSHLAFRAPLLSRASKVQSAASTNITPAPNIPWHLIGPAQNHLLEELENLYWEGVRGELEIIIRTLRIWQQQNYSSVVLDDENDDFIHGFDTFIDQVSQESRAFATRYGELREKEMKDKGASKTGGSYEDALVNRTLDLNADRSSSQIKLAVRQAIEDIQQGTGTGIHRRAKMLLQTAGFLDIDKLIEHRPPLDKLSFWKRPAIPQLTLSKFDKHWKPIFVPLHCSSCSNIIRGSMFNKLGQAETGTICEDCYRVYCYGQDSFVKAYKHCILAKVITPAASRNICHCATVPHFDNSGRSRSLFPVEIEEKHLNVDGTGGIQCGILKLGELVALAKYDGIQTVVGVTARRKLRDIAQVSKPQNEGKKARHEAKVAKVAKVSGWRRPQLKTVTGTSLHDAKQRTVTSGATTAATEAEADEDIPFFFRKYTEKYPFGNVHMSLRVGPLVIENGVAHTKGGALITIRDPPALQVPHDLGDKRERSLALSGGTERTLWVQQRPKEKPKRYKAVMKQVVGAPFSGLLDQSLEREIVEDLISASQRKFDDPGLHISEQRKLLDQALNGLLAKLRALIESRVKIYLRSVAEQLLEAKTIISWSATKNNCQNFCNSLINPDIFEPLISSVNSPSDTIPNPLYLMSFVCSQESYVKRPVKTKFDVPSGLTEEYLLKFRYGRHDEADMIDTLHEYWYDWGAFGSPLYRYQDLFPWDCTEAYGRYPTTCGTCNLAKHVWAFPFDSWSIITLHLTHDRYMYAPTPLPSSSSSAAGASDPPPHIISHQSWMRNRLTLLLASDVLTTAAAAMSRTPKFRTSTAWLHQRQQQQSVHDPALARLKLGGIHRAQPFSHYFEAGTYSHYFIAEWAHLTRQAQIRAYEQMRDGRVKLPDVVYEGGRFGAAGSGGGPQKKEHFHGFGGAGAVDGVAAGPVFSADVGIAQVDAGFLGMDLGVGMVDVGPTCATGCASNCGGTGCGSSACGGGACGGGGGGCGSGACGSGACGSGACGGGGCGGGGCGGCG